MHKIFENCPLLNSYHEHNFNQTLEIGVSKQMGAISKEIAKKELKKIIDIIIDPGFGFGKSIEHNFEILSNLEHFSMLDLPILTGFSRKSMIFKTLNTDKENALNGTSVLNTIALMKGVKILRVHDVKEAKECVLLYNKSK